MLRYPKSEAEKAAKKKLHQVWGAYFTRPNFEKIIEKIKKELEKGVDIKEVLLPILKLQTSTNERIPILNDLYSQIFSTIGESKTIIEPACGLNALTWFWMNPQVIYKGFDVDREQIDFINKVFDLTETQETASVELGDVLADESDYDADVVLLLKVLPLLEHQKKGCSINVLRKFKCEYLVVSFPTRSISGMDKGMTVFYTKWFADMISPESWEIEKLTFDTELVFCIKK